MPAIGRSHWSSIEPSMEFLPSFVNVTSALPAVTRLDGVHVLREIEPPLSKQKPFLLTETT